ncbi:MAG: hypothetical protein NVS2B7_31530 [Herpetosiphon sp.]
MHLNVYTAEENARTLLDEKRQAAARQRMVRAMLQQRIGTMAALRGHILTMLRQVALILRREKMEAATTTPCNDVNGC